MSTADETKSGLCLLTEQTVKKLLTETGHVLSLNDVPAIAALDRVAARIEQPDEPEERDILSLPVRAGNVLLYKLSLGAAAWIEERAAKWFEDKPVFGDLAVAFASAHSKEPEVLQAIIERSEAVNSITKWKRTIGCDYESLMNGVQKILPEVDDTTNTGGKAAYGPIIAMLQREYGATPDYWLWDADPDTIESMLDDMEIRAEVEDKALREMAAKAKQSVPPRVTPRLIRITKFRDMTNALREKWQKKT